LNILIIPNQIFLNILNALKQSLLIKNVRKGQNIYYSLNTTLFQEVTNWFFDTIHVNVNEGGVENGKDK
jgi:hypothetical protein